MFEAYKIGIRLSLVSNVATGLAMMSRQFTSTAGQGKALELQIKRIQALAMVGGAVTGIGLFGLKMMGDALDPAKEYAHQLNVMNMAGLTHAQQVEAIGAAWKNTGTVITTTATENLKSLLDLRNVLGDMGEAEMALPIVTRIQAVLASSTEGRVSSNSKDLAFGMAKALDVIGAARDPKTFQTQAELMAKVITATQGRVTPDQFLSVFRYARQAKFGLNNEFLYEILPGLMLENAGSGGGGGGSRGVGPMLSAFYRLTNQGFINKKSLPLLAQLGLINPNSAMSTSTTGTMVDAMKGHELAASNPFQWVQSVLLPAIYGAYGKNISREKLQQVINDVFRGNQLGANLALEFALKPKNFLRDQGIIRGTMGAADAYQAALSNDPGTAQKALDSQWENLKVSFMMGVVPILVPLLTKLANVFMFIGDILRDHPLLAQSLAIGFTTLFAALGLVIGPVLLLKAAMGAMSLALPGVVSSLGMASGALTLLGKAGALGAAGLAGYTLGSFLASAINWAIQKVRGDDKATLGTSIYDLFHYGNPTGFSQRPLNNGGTYSGAPHYGPTAVGPHSGSKPIQVHSTINLDGRKVAHAVTTHQAREMSRPNTGSQGIRAADTFVGSDVPGAGMVSP